MVYCLILTLAVLVQCNAINDAAGWEDVRDAIGTFPRSFSVPHRERKGIYYEPAINIVVSR